MAEESDLTKIIKKMRADLAALERAHEIMKEQGTKPSKVGRNGKAPTLRLRKGSLNSKIVDWFMAQPPTPRTARDVATAMAAKIQVVRSALGRLVEGGWIDKTEDGKFCFIPQSAEEEGVDRVV